MRIRVFWALLSVLMTACAAQPAKLQSTRWPSVTVAAPPDFVRDQMVAFIAASSMTLTDSSDNMIRVQMPVEGGRGFWTQALVGCATCDKPRDMATFVLAGVRGGTLLSAQYWTEVQQFNGSWKRVENQNATAFNGTLGELEKFRAEIEQRYVGLR